jgi:flagellum-specific ATP synthase
MMIGFEAGQLAAALSKAAPVWFGRVVGVEGARIQIEGLGGVGRLGDRVTLHARNDARIEAEVIALSGQLLSAYAFGATRGLSAGDRAVLNKSATIARPSEDWLGCVLNWRGQRIDGSTPMRGLFALGLDAAPPAAPRRRRLGSRLATHHAAFDTFLPICRGQRVGLFAGSGVGKSMLLGSLARRVAADVCVIALIGERGREVRHFVEETLGPDGLERAVVIASTSDESALAKREGARLALTVAEYFRMTGKQVLLVFDSLTRYAEAHREIALAAGEPPSLHAFPPSTFNAIASLAERAGPGVEGEGDITAIFSVLVAGSDMEEPVADMVRGILDGHFVLDRTIAERGRYPAINIRRSVSRSLPAAASVAENALLADARSLLSAYEDAEMIIRAGLYEPGSDARIDRAIRIFPHLDAFIGRQTDGPPEESFRLLETVLNGGPIT